MHCFGIYRKPSDAGLWSMKFPLAVTCGYPSYEETGQNFEDSDWKALNLVKAIKGKPFKGYAPFGQHRVDDTSRGRAIALRLVAQDAARRLRALGLTGALVPIPASDHTIHGQTFTGSRLCEAIAHVDDGFSAKPILRFTKVMPKASSGAANARSAREIAAHLEMLERPADDRCILVDDVATTHGHLRGVARFLHGQGVTVVGAYAVAQTIRQRPENMFDRPVQEIDTDPMGFGF